MALGTRSRILSLTEADKLEDHKRLKDIWSKKRIVNGPAFEFCMLKVVESLAALNPNKSAGYDKIFPKLLLARDELAPQGGGGVLLISSDGNYRMEPKVKTQKNP